MIFPPVVIAGSPTLAASIEFIQRSTTGSGSAAKTISGVSFGDVLLGRNERWIVACVETVDSGTPASVAASPAPTIGGVTATNIFSATTGTVASLNWRFSWLAAEVPTGASGDVTFTLTGSSPTSPYPVHIFKVINLDLSAVTDSDANAGTGSAVLAIDCNAGGGVLGVGRYAYSGGSTPTTADFNNLDTLNFFDSNNGWTQAGTVFASAQTGLDVTYDPTPNTNITRSHASVISVPYSFA